MATKQTEELGYYNGHLPYIEDNDTILQASLLTWHEWENKRIEISKFVDYLQNTLSFPKDYVEIAADGTRSISLDSIKSASHYTRGINFPDGISLGDNDIDESWIGYWQLTPSSYGFDSATAIPANVCYGTFGMETMYVQDLYVKNLHTSQSEPSDGNKTIQNLTVGKIIPSEITGFIDVDGNFAFNSNNESGTLKFEDGEFKLSNDLTLGSGNRGRLSAALVYANELSPRNTDSNGEHLTYMYGGFSFVNVFPNQRYLVAGNDDNAVFNSNGGLTEIYSQTEIDTKLQPLTQLESYFKGSLGDFNSTSDFRSALNNMIKDKKEAGRYVATLYGSLIIVTFALLDKSSGTYSQWVEGSIIKGSDGELYLNNELGCRICGRVGLGTTWGVWRANVLDDELPIAATKSHDGLMSKEDKTAFENMKTAIESLEARIAALEAK